MTGSVVPAFLGNRAGPRMNPQIARRPAGAADLGALLRLPRREG
jgi:hypothetical protein